jgi:hypothetical protein
MGTCSLLMEHAFLISAVLQPAALSEDWCCPAQPMHALGLATPMGPLLHAS